MTVKEFLSTCIFTALCFSLPIAAQAAESTTDTPYPARAPATQDAQTRTNADTPDGRLAAINKLPPAERVEQFEAFLKSEPDASLRPRALELLTVARAAFGDEKLRGGDAVGGVELFRLAVAEAPAEMPEKLFVEVVSQLPSNLQLRGENAAALDLARRIENRVKDNPQRLLTVAAFYLSVEQSDEAARVAQMATRLAPDSAAAHAALGLAHRIALRLDAATKDFARALELDARLSSARRNLADLYRAAGKPDEALALYRELLTADPKDAGARAGMVLALFDAGKKEEAEKELQAALKEDERNLSLLVGAAYWHAAHGDGARALELSDRAVRIEPRYTWAHIAFARALVAQKRPLEAERALRFAHQYGRFPTLDYELANTLAASGLYEEAAEELLRSFTIKGGRIETQLAGRIPARAADFIELLAPERRASIYQFAAADTEANARMLKGLLAFHQATSGQSGSGRPRAGETEMLNAAADFVGADDELRAFRQIYVAERLLRRGAALPVVLEMTEAAAGGVEAALDSPVASVAVLADSLRDIRARVIAAGATTDLPGVPRNILSNIMRGRIEDIAGWALYSQGQAADATPRLRRAVSVLPENTLWWRDALWHLGTTLSATGSHAEALPLMLRSYDRQSPNLARRAIIEALYTRVNGSLRNFEDKLGAPLPVPIASASPTPAGASSPAGETSSPPASTSPVSSRSPLGSGTVKRRSDNRARAKAAETKSVAEPVESARVKGAPPESSDPAPGTSVAAATDTAPARVEPPKTNLPTEAAAPATAPPPTATGTAGGDAPETRQAAPDAQPASPSTSETAATSTAAPKATRSRRARGGGGSAGGSCSLSVSASELTIGQGGSTPVTLSFDRAVNPSSVKAATRNWSDILVLAETASAADADSLKFTITSVSRTAGTFVVTFNTPCGKQEVTVTVK